MGMLNAEELLSKYNRAALPSFDIGGGNIDFVESAFIAAEKSQKGMYLSSTPSTVQNYLGYEGYVTVIKMIAKKYPTVDYAIHLDHAKDIKFVELALNAGYSSVMYDGSHLSFEENLKNTIDVVTQAKKFNATVESELGAIGGKEDEIEGEEECLPSYEEVVDFVKRSGTCLMAPAVGTVHGHFRGEPKLNWPVIERLASAPGNYVLHGCTGLDLEIIGKVAKLCFVKFNFATALRESFLKGMLGHIQEHPDDIKPYAYLKAGRKELAEYMTVLFQTLKT